MTPRGPGARQEGIFAGSPPSFLFVAWESIMTPSRTATHFFIAIRIRVNSARKFRVIDIQTEFL
jgi:hypothetical protein